MSGFPYIFTFYSFKGGVGRSMALLNTAYTLAGWGKHVLIVDLDLEAPGVSSFLKESKEFAPPVGKRTLDVLGFLGEAISLADKGLGAKEMAGKLPELSHYIRRVDPAKLEPLTPKLGKLGNLDVLGADLDRDWCRRLSALGLQRLSQESLVEISMALHLYFKSYRFKHRGLGLEDFEPDEEVPYDYILLDSRTGITEIGGLCIGPVADRLVVLSALNEQNIEGTLMVLKEAGIEPRRRSAKSKPWDSADSPGDPDRLTLGPKPTVVVASPVPNGEIGFKRERLDNLEKRLGIRPLRLSYHPQMALVEGIFVRDFKEEYLAREYLELANSVVAQAGEHPAQLAREIANLSRKKENPEHLISLTLRLAAQQPDGGLPLLLQSSARLEPSGEAELRAAKELHATISNLEEYSQIALFNWGLALVDLSKIKDGDEAEAFLEAGMKKYEKSHKLNPTDHDVLNNWANALSRQAETREGDELDHLFNAAGGKYALAHKLQPHDHEVVYNWGVALSRQADRKDGAEAADLMKLAERKYAMAYKLDSGDYEVLASWGDVLFKRFLNGDAKDVKLLKSAIGKYESAYVINQQSYQVMNNWGNALVRLGQAEDFPQSKETFKIAAEKFALAEKLNPVAYRVPFNWGNLLFAQANEEEGSQRRRLLEEAGEKYASAHALAPENSRILFNWGVSIVYHAESSGKKEANLLLGIAADKYAQAYQLDPEDAEVLNGWGDVLLRQGKRSESRKAEFFEQASEKLREAEKLVPGIAAYNLACLEAVQANEAESIRWLRSIDHLTRGVLLEDDDFDPIRDLPAFQKYLRTLPEE